MDSNGDRRRKPVAFEESLCVILAGAALGAGVWALVAYLIAT